MKNTRILWIALSMLVVGYLDHVSILRGSSFDYICRELYFIPILLGAAWFGKRGALAASLCASALFLPCVLLAAPISGAQYIGNFMELILFNAVGAGIGVLKDREHRLANEKLEAVKAMAGAVEHELNNPLAIALIAAELIKEEEKPDWDHREDMDTLINSLKRTSGIIKKIAKIDHIELMNYAGDYKIVDVMKSSKA